MNPDHMTRSPVQAGFTAVSKHASAISAWYGAELRRSFAAKRADLRDLADQWIVLYGKRAA